MQLVPVTFGGPRSCNGLLSWHSARPHAWACIVGLLEKRVFFDNPDMGYDGVLRRCANDAKFASGGLLVDALFRFGLHMCDLENVVRDAYLEALEDAITCVIIDGASSQLAAAWLGCASERRPQPGASPAVPWLTSWKHACRG